MCWHVSLSRYGWWRLALILWHIHTERLQSLPVFPHIYSVHPISPSVLYFPFLLNVIWNLGSSHTFSSFSFFNISSILLGFSSMKKKTREENHSSRFSMKKKKKKKVIFSTVTRFVASIPNKCDVFRFTRTLFSQSGDLMFELLSLLRYASKVAITVRHYVLNYKLNLFRVLFRSAILYLPTWIASEHGIEWFD